MTPNPEQLALADVISMEEFDAKVLEELAVEIKEDGGHDTWELKPQDFLDALADVPTTPWRDVAWGLGETFAGYVAVDFKRNAPSKREALKIMLCVSIMGVTCRHGQAWQFAHHFDYILVLMAKTVEVLRFGGQQEVLALALRNCEWGQERESEAKRLKSEGAAPDGGT